jgi:hypothetical protein
VCIRRRNHPIERADLDQHGRSDESRPSGSSGRAGARPYVFIGYAVRGSRTRVVACISRRANALAASVAPVAQAIRATLWVATLAGVPSGRARGRSYTNLCQSHAGGALRRLGLAASSV